MESVIAALKDGDGDAFAIPVFVDGVAQGRLRPIGWKRARDPLVWDLLCGWRAANMERFLTRFEPSPEKTRAFLLDFSLPDPRRLLFLVETGEGEAIGHVGICDVAEGRMELDNVLRGRPGGPPGLMAAAVRALLDWGVSALGTRRVVLSVLDGNDRAVSFYRSLGFETTGIVPLRASTSERGTTLSPVDDGGPPNVAERLRTMAWTAG